MALPGEADAVELICRFEGYHRRLPDGMAAPYLCPARVPTIGYGSIWRLDGTRVEMTDPPISRDDAMTLMLREVRHKCAADVDRLITVPLSPLQRAALVSFVYNLGGGALKASNLRKAINERRFSDVPAELAKWRFGGGRELPGLMARRAAEARMFMAGAASTVGGEGWLATVHRA